MARKNYQVDEVLRMISKHPLIVVKDYTITCSPSSNPDARNAIGNSIRGKLDFLAKHGYTIIWKTENSNVDTKLKPIKGDAKEIVTVDTVDVSKPVVESVSHIHPAKRKVKSIYA